MSALLIIGPDSDHIQLFSDYFVPDCAVGDPRNTVQDLAKVRCWSRVFRVLIPQFHIDIVPAGTDLFSFTVKEDQELWSDDRIDLGEVLPVNEPGIFVDHLRRPDSIIQIEVLSRSVQVLFILIHTVKLEVEHIQNGRRFFDFLVDIAESAHIHTETEYQDGGKDPVR